MKLKIVNTLLLLAGTAGLSEAYAACAPSSGFRPQDVLMSVGRVVVKPSDPVGKVLRKATFPISSNGSEIKCDRGTPSSINAVLTQGYPAAPSGGPNVYSTNIPGIGIRLYREAEGAQQFSGYYPYKRALERNKTYTLATGYFVVEIVKTAPTTGSGTLVPGLYSTYHVDGYPDKPLLTSTVLANAITIASSSCEIQGNINKVVQLPTVKKADFNGVGSTQGEQAFNLNILCNGGDNPTGIDVSNDISLSFDYPAVSGTNNQVILNDAPESTRAKGVGTQIVWNYEGENRVIAKGDKLAVGTVHSGQQTQYDVPLIARYYQTEPTVSAGTVRGMASVTIEYD
ncbi:fimbrial protein [Acinetobacter sp.]|uniref:fimbrial protein n=1 Tax=Acinetobacter sp. TaxID=472 RepID=UPI0035B32736